jgi:hypothetical protein
MKSLLIYITILQDYTPRTLLLLLLLLLLVIALLLTVPHVRFKVLTAVQMSTLFCYCDAVRVQRNNLDMAPSGHVQAQATQHNENVMTTCITKANVFSTKKNKTSSGS